MDIQTRHTPSFSVARALLGPNESLRLESGAMMAMAADMDLDAKVEGGLKKGLKRSVLGGESMYITTATAGQQGGWIDVAASLPGDVAVVDLVEGEPMMIQKGSFLCAEQGVEIDTKFGGLKSMLGGEGAFLLRATGQGKLVLSTYGALDRFTLEAGQAVIVDTNHMVAFAESVTMELKKVNESKMKSLKSGEGYVFNFTGPGELMMQSRNPDDLIRYLASNGLGNRS